MWGSLPVLGCMNKKKQPGKPAKSVKPTTKAQFIYCQDGEPRERKFWVTTFNELPLEAPNSAHEQTRKDLIEKFGPKNEKGHYDAGNHELWTAVWDGSKYRFGARIGVVDGDEFAYLRSFQNDKKLDNLEEVEESCLKGVRTIEHRTQSQKVAARFKASQAT